MEIVEKGDAVEFAVRVVPRASRSEIVGEHNGELKLRIAAPPVDGAANAEVIKLLARSFDVPRANLEIVAGYASRSKRVLIKGVTRQDCERITGS